MAGPGKRAAAPKQAASGRRTILWVVLAVFVVVAALAAIGAVTDDGGGGSSSGDLNELAQAAGCLAVEEDDLPEKNPAKHVNGEVDYDEAPPSWGDHSPRTLRNAKRFYSRDDKPSIEQAVHNLEHGLVVAWYDEELPDDQVQILEDTSQDMSGRYVAVPWDRDAFEGGRHFVLTAWGVRQRCQQVSPEHIKAFIEEHADTKAPEKGYSV